MQITNKNKKSYCFKILISLALGFMSLSITCIFVTQSYFNKISNSNIWQTAILTDFHYSQWGKLPTNTDDSIIKQTYTPYNHIKNQQVKLANESLNYNFSYEYSNLTFASGDSGQLSFINSWKRQLLTSPSQIINLTIPNLAAQQVYSYDYYAPKIRKFTIMYNTLINSFLTQLLPQLYSKHIFEYFFSNFNLVYKTIYQPANFTKQKSQFLYYHPIYGWNKFQTLTKWIEIALNNNNYFLHPNYRIIRNLLSLNEIQIKYLIGIDSTLNQLIQVVNYTIKSNLYTLNPQNCQSNYCTNQELLSLQFGLSYLTNYSIFNNISLNTTIFQINSTLLNEIEYNTFCSNNINLQCLDESSSISFFLNKYFNNFSSIQYIQTNKNYPNNIQNYFNLPTNTTQSIISYYQYLYSKIFNINSYNHNNNNNNNNTFNIEEQAFKQVYTTFNYLQPTINIFNQVMLSELYSRAYYNKYINNTSVKCQEYFLNQYTTYVDLCKDSEFNIIGSLKVIRLYMNAYLFNNISFLLEHSSMNEQTIFQFVQFDKNNSLLAKNIQNIEHIFAKQYNCNDVKCNKFDLLAMQWGNNTILTNLPLELFINKTKINIIQWDQQNKLKLFQPQYCKVIQNSIISFNQSKLLLSSSNSNSIFNLFNLMKLWKYNHTHSYLLYAKEIVIHIIFNGYYVERSAKQFINGYSFDEVKIKQMIDPALGGAPWLPSSKPIAIPSHQPISKDVMNTGIYSQSMLRQLSFIQGSNVSFGTYLIYQDSNITLNTSIYSNKSVKGSSLLGFHLGIEKKDKLSIYLNIAYSQIELQYVKQFAFESVQAFYYKLISNQKISLEIEQLSKRYLIINNNSYIIINPQTSLTLEINISYNIFLEPNYNRGQILPLYNSLIFYHRSNLNKIILIQYNQYLSNIFLILFLILSSISLIIAIVFTVLLVRIKTKAYRERKFSQPFLDIQYKQSPI